MFNPSSHLNRENSDKRGQNFSTNGLLGGGRSAPIGFGPYRYQVLKQMNLKNTSQCALEGQKVSRAESFAFLGIFRESFFQV